MEPESEAVPRDEAADLQVEVIPGRKYTLSGVKNSVRVVMRIRTPPDNREQDRPPISVACVLDRSGSMGGSKLNFAKRACKKLVKHLNPGDSLHFIAYDDKVSTIFENGDLSESGKEAMKIKIDEIKAGATTNLYGGLERAATLLGGRTDFDSKTPIHASEDTRARRIFLFSDGCVNAGITDPHEIRRRVAAWAEQGIITTSFGIGADFDEPLMRGIAESGKGRYTFLANGEDIPRLVSKSIHDLLKLYGSEATVDIRGGAYTTVSKIYRGGDDDEGSYDAAASGLLHLGDLHDDNERMVLLELDSAPPGDDPLNGRSYKAAEWFLTFQRDGAPVQFSGSVGLVAVKDRSSLGNEAASVQAMFAIRRSSDLDAEIAQHLSHRDKVRARDVKSQQISLLKETLECVRSDPQVDRVDLEALEAVLRRAESVAEQLDDGEDMELVRRHCVQEMELCRAMSVAGFSDGCDSDASPPGDGEDTGARTLQRRLREFDDMSDGSDITTTDSIDSPRPSPRSPCGPQPVANPEPIDQSVHRPQKKQKQVSCSLM